MDFDDKFPPAYVKIEIDANNTPVTRYVIHELIHVAVSELVFGRFDDTLEEVLVCALDGDIFEYAQKRKSRLAKWEALIEKKLAANSAEPTPHEDLVNRPALPD